MYKGKILNSDRKTTSESYPPPPPNNIESDPYECHILKSLGIRQWTMKTVNPFVD